MEERREEGQFQRDARRPVSSMGQSRYCSLSVSLKLLFFLLFRQIHDHLVSLSSFSAPHFTSLNWRLDVQTHSRYVNEMNQPTAIVQINTKVRRKAIMETTQDKAHVESTNQIQLSRR